MPIPAGYAIDAQLQSMPLVGVLAGHLRAHAGAGVDVLASGEVGGVEKVYAAARVMPDLGQVGTTRTTRAGTGALVLAEFVLQRASSSVYMVFKPARCASKAFNLVGN